MINNYGAIAPGRLSYSAGPYGLTLINISIIDRRIELKCLVLRKANRVINDRRLIIIADNSYINLRLSTCTEVILNCVRKRFKASLSGW